MRYLKFLAMATVLGACALIAGCATTPGSEGQTKAEVAYDNICRTEPVVFLTIVVVNEAKPLPEKLMKAADKAHGAVTYLCAHRPTDLISGLETLTGYYTEVLKAAD